LNKDLPDPDILSKELKQPERNFLFLATNRHSSTHSIHPERNEIEKIEERGKAFMRRQTEA
jgi:hypothetical protein